jgi:hypothetical protein
LLSVKHLPEVAKKFAEWIQLPNMLEAFISESHHNSKRRDLIQHTLNDNTFFNRMSQYWDRSVQQTILLSLGNFDFGLNNGITK